MRAAGGHSDEAHREAVVRQSQWLLARSVDVVRRAVGVQREPARVQRVGEFSLVAEVCMRVWVAEPTCQGGDVHFGAEKLPRGNGYAYGSWYTLLTTGLRFCRGSR
jgi:hypothetical protein